MKQPNFKITISSNIPEGSMFFLPDRKYNEKDEEYAKRCVIIENLGDFLCPLNQTPKE